MENSARTKRREQASREGERREHPHTQDYGQSNHVRAEENWMRIRYWSKRQDILKPGNVWRGCKSSGDEKHVSGTLGTVRQVCVCVQQAGGDKGAKDT